MKKGVFPLALACVLLLSGCSAMLERSHGSSTPHVDYTVIEDDSVLRAESYPGLVSSILYFIGEHSEDGSIRLYNYAGDVEDDLASAREEALRQDPIGAFAVRSLSYDCTRVLTYYEVTVHITYSRTAQEVEDVQPVAGVAGLRQELNRLVAERRDSAVYLTSYFSGDAALAEELLLLAWYSQPALCVDPGPPDCRIALYPETGARRIIELKLHLPQRSPQELEDRAARLEQTAARLLEAAPPAGASYTVEELAAIVRAAGGYDGDGGTQLPLETLSGESAGDEGLLLAMEYLCQLAGIEVSPVYGSEGLWLIVSTPDGYRHLLPQGLRPFEEPPEGSPTEEGPEPPPLLYTDEQLAELGYSWPASLHPSCVDHGAPPSAPAEDPGSS